MRVMEHPGSMVVERLIGFFVHMRLYVRAAANCFFYICDSPRARY